MLTKKRLRYWLNSGTLVVGAIVVVLTAIHERSTIGEKVVVIGTIVGVARATLPWVRSGLDKVVAESDLPEDEPTEAAK